MASAGGKSVDRNPAVLDKAFLTQGSRAVVAPPREGHRPEALPPGKEILWVLILNRARFLLPVLMFAIVGIRAEPETFIVPAVTEGSASAAGIENINVQPLRTPAAVPALTNFRAV